jgi:predicted nucleic acid-binding protein
VPVVDASVVVDWVAPDADADGPARRYLRHLVEHDAAVLAPRLLREEVANALLSGVRRQRWAGADADAAFNLLTLAPIHWVDEQEDLASAWELARRYDEHPIYDLLYVAVAERLGEQLVTADERLLAKLSGRQSVVALPS